MTENKEENASLAGFSAAKFLFEGRYLVVSEGINSKVAKSVIEQLYAFDAADSKKDIVMVLNSPGGEVNSGYAIYDTMRFIRPDVKVVVSGLCASIATVIFLGAKKEHRFSLPNSRFLIHQPLISGHVQGQASDIEITAREIMKTREKIAHLYVQETGKNFDQVMQDIERDYWMNADEAKDYGLLTTIVDKWTDAL